MFSIFPPLLSYSEFSPLLLRMTLGVVFVFWAGSRFKEKKNMSLAGLEVIVGLLLIAGFLTQVAALVSTIILGVRIFGKIRAKAFLTNGVNYYLILLVISICLIVTGAGFYAFDLPL